MTVKHWDTVDDSLRNFAPYGSKRKKEYGLNESWGRGHHEDTATLRHPPPTRDTNVTIPGRYLLVASFGRTGGVPRVLLRIQPGRTQRRRQASRLSTENITAPCPTPPRPGQTTPGHGRPEVPTHGTDSCPPPPSALRKCLSFGLQPWPGVSLDEGDGRLHDRVIGLLSVPQLVLADALEGVARRYVLASSV